jgi:hypothetical protein
VKIVSKLNDKCLEIASVPSSKCPVGTLIVNTSAGYASQSFFLERVSELIYMIRCKTSKKVLDVCNEST